MTGSTINYGFPYPEGGDAVLTHIDIEKLAEAADAQVFSVDSAVDSVKWNFASSPLTASDVLDGLSSGMYSVWNGSVAEAIGLPMNLQGTVEVVRWGQAGGVAEFATRSNPPQLWRTARLSGGWVDWVQVGGNPNTAKTSLLPASPRSLKSSGLAFTTGYGGEVTSGSAETSVIQYVASSVSRAQVCIRNWNPRYATADRPAATLTDVRIGRHVGGGVGDSWVTLPGGATEYESGWIALPDALRGTEVVIEYTWSGSEVSRTLGTAWEAGARTNYPGLFVWLDVEVPADVPVVAAFGSSTAAGVGASRPMIDSWLSQWCMANDAVPAFWAHSGDSAVSWVSKADRKWELYGTDIAAPDALLYAMGSNDWAGGASLEELQSRIAGTVAEISERITPNVFGTTITPRATPPANDSTRLALNEWMPESGLFRDVFDFAAAVSLPDGSLDPAVDADGTHVNTAGHARLAAAIDRPVVSVGDSGDGSAREWQTTVPLTDQWRTDVDSSVTAYRSGNVVTVAAWRLATVESTTASVPAYSLPVGYTPIALTQSYTRDSRGKDVVLTYSGAASVTAPSTSVSHHSFTFITGDPEPPDSDAVVWDGHEADQFVTDDEEAS